MTLLLIVAAVLTRPDHAQCPINMYVNGVRPTGDYACRPVPPRQSREEIAPFPRLTPLPGEDLELRGAIYCTGGSSPIVVDYRTVGCEARH